MTKSKFYFEHCILFSATIIYFHAGFSYLWKVLSSKQYYESNFLFLILLGLIVSFIVKHRDKLKPRKNIQAFLLLLGCTTAYLINELIFYFGLVKGVLAITSLYALLGFYFDKKLWQRLSLLLVILIFTLPFLDAMQRFLGFPLRIITAKVVSFIIGLIGFTNINQSTVILTENNVTSIDIPCSGVKSLYIGFLFLLAFFYIKNIRLNKKVILVASVFLVSLVVVNIWRVFSLVFVHDILNMTSLADQIHVGLGLLGFMLSCLSLVYLTKKHLSVNHQKNKKTNTTKRQKNNWTFLPLGKIANNTILMLLLINFIFVKNVVRNIKKPQNPIQKKEYNLAFSEAYQMTEVPFSQVENDFFVINKVKFYKKYNGSLGDKSFALILITSDSARSHHDPKVCLQGAGNQVIDQELVNFANQSARHLILSQSNHAYYYFIDGQGVLLNDVSQRVWDNLKEPNKLWTLVILASNKPLDYNNPQLVSLIQEINQQAMSLNQL